MKEIFLLNIKISQHIGTQDKIRFISRNNLFCQKLTLK